jgi:hypothetical protein
MSSAMNLVTLGILPLAAVVFLVWMAVRNLQNNLSAASRWSLVAVAGLGLMLMPLARFGGSVMIWPEHGPWAHGFGGGGAIAAFSPRRHGRWVKSSAPHFAQIRKPSISSARVSMLAPRAPTLRVS